MYKFICVLAFVGAAYAASIGAGVESTTEKREIIPLLRYETDRKPDGSFSFSYEGGDQSARDEAGVVENVGTEEETLEVHGSYRYIDADGQEIEVHYTAGKNGFVPIGTNIPAEISEAAKAAADQPNEPVETEKVKRAAPSNKEGKEEEGGEKEKESKGGKQENEEKEVKEEKEVTEQKAGNEEKGGHKQKEGKEEKERQEEEVVKGKNEEQEEPKETVKEERVEKPEEEEKAGKAEEGKKGEEKEVEKQDEEKSVKSEKSEKSEKPEKSEKSEESEKSEKSEKEE
ncbi:uncharacterized protein [Bactrocera oleae]|uniref:uncharacterized protein n=1 Tax=Bactrocera oleae TaxID=104688 RepID=UPI00387E5AC1